MKKVISIILLGLVLIGCNIDDESPDESITVHTQYSDGTSDSTTYDYYYKEGEDEAKED